MLLKKLFSRIAIMNAGNLFRLFFPGVLFMCFYRPLDPPKPFSLQNCNDLSFFFH